MTFTLEDFNGMEIIWLEIENKPDENHAIITSAELEAMWQVGLIDTSRFPMDVWKAAFEGYKRPDGTYFISRDDFLAKEPYRYKGEIMVPLDAMAINEGFYTEEGLKELFDMSVAPSCGLSRAELGKFFDELKSRHKDERGLIKIEKTAKLEIKKLLDEAPSPLRRLELFFDYLIKNPELFMNQNPEGHSESLKMGAVVSPSQIARLQASSFSMRPSDTASEKREALGAIEKRRTKPPATDSVAKDASVEVSKVKRSRKGIRG